MKRFDKLLVSLLSTTTISGVIDPPLQPEINAFKVDSDIVLSGFTNRDEVLPLTFSTVAYYQYKMEIQFVNIATKEFVYERVIPLKEIGFYAEETTFDLSLPFEEYLSSDGLNIILTHHLKSPNKDISTAAVYPFYEEEINVAMYRKEPYVRKGVYLSIDDSKIHSTEEYDFTDLNEYITVEKGNKLDLSHLKFKYNCPHELSCGDIYLKIKDYNNLFPHLNKSNGEVSLKMKFTQENNEITLSLEEPLYVNNYTHDMSSIPLDDYVETNTLYVPYGKEELLMDDEIYITIKDAGFSLTDFVVPFNFYFSNKYLGECYDSDYCITGGVKQ